MLFTVVIVSISWWRVIVDVVYSCDCFYLLVESDC